MARSHYIFLTSLFLVLPGVLNLSLLTSCSSNDTPPAMGSTWNYDFPYNINEPDETLVLASILREISGLSTHSNPNYLAAVQDEEGKIFLINKKTGSIEEQIDFWKEGDYEGIEVVGNDYYVIKSSGTIYKVLSKDDTEKHKNFLTKENDVEGLCYDAKNNQLLLACKAKAGDGKEFKLSKSIFAYDLEQERLLQKPKYVITLDAVNDYLKTDPAIRKLEKIIDFFQPNESELTFAPSAIAIHPVSGDIYVLSSVGNLLMVMSTAGNILHIEKLKKNIHPQPEGMCFDKDGTLFIANEGKKSPGRIVQFGMR